MTHPSPVNPLNPPTATAPTSPSQLVRERRSAVRRWVVIGVAVAGLIAAAVAEGISSGRWNQSDDVRAAAAKFDAVPASFGDWTSTEAPMAEKVLAVAEAAGHVSRTYTNRKSRAQVSVLLLCGPSGPIGAHPPEVCYAGTGFGMTGAPQKKSVGSATYWSVLFDKTPATPEPPLRVCWAWGTDGDWHASTSPRTEFALRGALYKLYVQRQETRRPEGAPPSTAPDPVHEFLKDFLPEVKKALAPSGRP